MALFRNEPNTHYVELKTDQNMVHLGLSVGYYALCRITTYFCSTESISYRILYLQSAKLLYSQ